MEESLFRSWDNSNKFIKAPYQQNIARIGHLEYLYDYLKENTLSNWELSEEGYKKGAVVFDTNGIYRNDLDGNTTQPSVGSPSNNWTLLADISTPYTPPYKVYSVLLTQTGTNAPTVKVLENTLGVVTTSYDSVGYYYFTSSNLFTASKTGTIISSGGAPGSLQYNAAAIWEDESNISVRTGNADFPVVPGNDRLQDTFFEIRVYN